MIKQTTVVCFGEVLWDILPTGKVAGGAPMNVAYHLHNLGIKSRMISSVGSDESGEELLKILQKKGIVTNFIQKNSNYPTGTVSIVLDENGSPSYEIHTPVAWDYISLEESNLSLVKEANAIVYGSLAARNEVSKTTLFQLLEAASTRIFDLNLRRPFYDEELLQKLLDYADIVKLSDEELAEITSSNFAPKTELERLQTLKEHYGLSGILLTKGKKGAVYLSEEGYFEQTAFTIQVKDTIGSGDASLSGFLSQFLQGTSPQNSLKIACVMGALVATYSGGTPEIKLEEVAQFIENCSPNY